MANTGKALINMDAHFNFRSYRPDEFEKNLPEALGNQIEKDWQNSINKNAAIKGQPIPESFYYLGGAMGRFRNIANKHFREMEK